jgi:hypothetical protein
VVYFWAAAVPLVGLAKVGSNHNYWIELAAAASVLATHDLWPDRPEPGRAAPPPEGSARGGAGRGGGAGPPSAAALVGWLSLAAAVLVGTPAGAPSLRLRPGPARADALQPVLERVRAEPRDVLASPLDVVVLADRPVLLEPYVFSLRYAQGRWDPGPLVRRICAGGVGLVVLDRPLERDPEPYHGYAHWPAPVLRALRATMVLERQQDGRYLYAPGPAAAPACGAD